MAEYEVKSKERVGPFAPIKKGHVVIAFQKEKKIIFFYKKAKSSLLFFQKLPTASFSLHVAFLPSSSPPLLPPLKLQIPLHFYPKLQGKAIFGT